MQKYQETTGFIRVSVRDLRSRTKVSRNKRFYMGFCPRLQVACKSIKDQQVLDGFLFATSGREQKYQETIGFIRFSACGLRSQAKVSRNDRFYKGFCSRPEAKVAGKTMKSPGFQDY